MPTTAPPNPPQQKRSRKTLSRIVAAGLSILEELGPEGLTVQRVVARARTSVGSFYQRFSGKDELLRFLEAELASGARARFEDELAERMSPDLDLAGRIAAIIELMTDEGATAAAADAARAAAVVATLMERRLEIRHPEPETAIRIGYAAVIGALREPTHGVVGDQLAHELGRLWLSYLGGGASKASSVDFFEVWG